METAEHLGDQKYKDPAAVVVVGSVLEEHLRQLCTAAGLPVEDLRQENGPTEGGYFERRPGQGWEVLETGPETNYGLAGSAKESSARKIFRMCGRTSRADVGGCG